MLFRSISVGFRRKSWTLYSILFLVRSNSFANGKIFSAPSVSLKGRQERSKRIKPRSDSSSFTILETVFRSISSSIDVLDMFFVTAVVKKTCHDKRFSLGFITLSIYDELMKYEPSEIICNQNFLVSGFDVEGLRGKYHISVNALEPHLFDDDGCRRLLLRHFKVNTLIGLGIEDRSEERRVGKEC